MCVFQHQHFSVFLLPIILM